MNGEQDGLDRAGRRVLSSAELGADQWLDLANHAFPGLSIDCYRDHVRGALLGARWLADAQVMEIACTNRLHVACARSPSGASDRYSLGLLVAGHCRSRHANREVVWGAGDLMLFDSARPFDAVHPAGFHLLMWHLPRQSLVPMLAAPDRSIGQHISGRTGPGAVLGQYARALASEAGRCDSATHQELLTHLFGLVGLALGASPAAQASRRETQRAYRRQQVLTYIEKHLHNPCLTAQRAAQDLRMSPRWLHAVLEDGRISFADRVTRRRLEECRRLLTSPAYNHFSVAEVAFRCGFNHLSTFYRRFRAQYGMTPCDARRLWRKDREAHH